jgi:hypothetical protein
LKKTGTVFLAWLCVVQFDEHLRGKLKAFLDFKITSFFRVSPDIFTYRWPIISF